MDTPGIKVSVVVVTYNQETTIARTLESILKQQCRFRYEIMLSDDCSTDRTPLICREYAERYPDIIRYHRNPSNLGVRDNYFDTILRCNGGYIADCAGDDYWIDPYKLQKQADTLDFDPGITLVHTNWEYQNALTGEITPSDPKGERAPYLKPVSSHGELFMPALQHKAHSIIHFCTAMFRKEVFCKAYSLDPHIFRCKDFTCEDLQLSVLYARSGKIAYIPDITMRYSVGHSSISSPGNHGKTFDFYLGALKLTVYLAEYYAVGKADMHETYNDFTSFLFAEAYFSKDRNRIQNILNLVEEHGLPLHWKSRYLVPTTRNRVIWNLCAIAKERISKLKDYK